MPKVSRRRSVAAPVPDVWKLVSDPHSLPRWWPHTARVENVERGGQRRGEWTQVLETSEGLGVRADFRCMSSAEPKRYAWEQRLEDTPFERHLKAARFQVDLAADEAGTKVEITSEQTLRGMSRLGGPLMRRGQGEILDAALDGIEDALVGGKP
jgi:uncharacterized protein YndB with AHSA1/START domain